MVNVSKEMVYAVRMARLADWERMAKELPGGHHILSVELLRTHRNETAIVFTVVHNGRVIQNELRGDANGLNARPIVTKPRGPKGCDDPIPGDQEPRFAAMTIAAPGAPPPPPDGGDGGPVADSIPLGEPPPKEEPLPGIIALGGSLLGLAFNVGENAIDADSPR